METWKLEFEDGELEVSRQALLDMNSGYFDALLASPCNGVTRLEGIFLHEFQDLLKLTASPWKEVALLNQNPLLLEEKCNKLILADRFQLDDIFRLYATNLKDSTLQDEFPAPVIQLLLEKGYALRRISAEGWATLLCEDGLPLEIYWEHRFTGHPEEEIAVICDHPQFSSALLESLLSRNLFASEVCKRAFYRCVKRKLLDSLSLLKALTFSFSNCTPWTLRIQTGTCPLKFDLVMDATHWNPSCHRVNRPEENDVACYEVLDEEGTLVRTTRTLREAQETPGNILKIRAVI